MNRLVLSAAAFALGLFAALLPIDSASAERRVALVVGNSAYQNVAVLPNPANDARAMGEKFKQAGFDVVSAHFDLGNLEFKRALRHFEDAASDADIAVVFYAGHGVEIRGTNYMVPVDARLAADRDADDEAITLDRLLQSVEGSKRLGLVILDACRDNPFLRNMKRTRVSAVRATSAGLTIVEPTARNTLIAYAAKAGAFAEDGDGKNSPFTGALLNSLFVPGLDVRLAFGRIRDEVLKDTHQRQEPFVSGSLGGAHISLVQPPAQPAAPAATADAASSDQRNDYSLVEKIGTQRAWQIFLTQHPDGFYADLARQQIAKLNIPGDPAPGTPVRKTDELPRSAEPPRPSSEEQRAWDRIKDTSNAAAFKDFIRRYPSSVLANTAQTRLEALEQAAKEREEQARLEREAKAAEATRIEEEKRVQAAAAAERQKAEREAALKRAEEERQSKAADAERQKAEREAALKRAEAERLAKAAAAAERQKEEREAALKRMEEERLAKAAEAAERQRIEREAAAQRAEEARHARQVEADRKKAEAEFQKAEQTAASKAAEADRLAKAAAESQREASLSRTEEERLAKLAEVARGRQEATCKREEFAIIVLQTTSDRSKAREDLERLGYDLTCERLRPNLLAALDKVSTMPEAPPSPPADMVRAAQQELARLGCFAGSVDGNLTDATKDALKRYQTQRGRPAVEPAIDDNLVSDLKDRRTRICPLVCPPGRVAEGEQCVVTRKPPAAPVARQNEDDKPVARPRQNVRQEREERPQPRVRQEAAAPRYSGGGGGGGGGGRSGGGGGGHGATIGVGF